MKAFSKIKITVGLVTYNRPEMLKEAVHSVLQQSFPNFELLISNDYLGSTVSFESMGIKYDSRIKIINQKSNLGEIRNLNYLLEIAQGDWFVWLADDDLFHSEFLMLANNAIHKSENVNMVGFFSNYISATNPDGLFPKSLKSNECIRFDDSDFLLNYTARNTALIGCYGVMRTDVLRKVGGLPQLGNSFGPYSDTLIPILLIQHGDLCWIDEKLIFLRTHAESQSCMSTEFSAYTSAEIEFIDQLKRVCGKAHLNINLNKFVSNMVIWFSENEWAVLNRNPLLTKLAVFKEFINYQININIPRLSLKYTIVHGIFIVHFLFKHFIFNFYRLILRVIKSRLW
ncbi:WcaA Glycosyltransferases involved in cell wall biogenesis [Methylophilaceae bacterium]